MKGFFLPLDFVAPHTGAWIETLDEKLQKEIIEVAPHTGAWIETLTEYETDILKRRTPHGCVD